MKRRETPDILGALLGGAPTPVHRPAPTVAARAAIARALLAEWQQDTTTEETPDIPRLTLTANPPPAPSGWLALSPTLTRLAERLAAHAGAGGTWLPEAECAAVFGTGAHGTQRNQLSSLKSAGVIDYARGEDGWFVRLCTNRAHTHGNHACTHE
jgi:hypothetical protein